MVMIRFEKRDFVWIGLVIVLGFVGYAYAFGGTNPSAVGHSSGEIQGFSELAARVSALEGRGASCQNQTIMWGTYNCASSAGDAVHGATRSLSFNLEPYFSGQATVVCNNGIWQIQSGATCA